MDIRRRRRFLFAVMGCAGLVLVSCRSFYPATIVAPPGEPAARRMSFDDVAVEWRIEDDQFVISFPHAGLGWSAVILGGRAAYIGADVIIVRSTRRGSEVLDAFVESGYSATVDEQLGGENQLRLIAVGQGRATVAKPLDGDEWDRDLAPGSRIRFAVAEGLLGVDTFPLLSLRETEVEL